MIGLQRLTGALACVCMLAAAPAAADVVTFWNGITATQAATPARGPAGTLDFAMVHLAMHDAIQAFQGRYEPYAFTPTLPAPGSPIAAAAAAAHGVLVNRFPLQETALNLVLANYLASEGLTGDPGIVVGVAAAIAMIANRTGDGSYPSPPTTFFGGTDPGEWRPTSFDAITGLPLSMTTPWLGSTVPFALRDPAQYLFAAGRPPRLHSWKYTRDYNEVKLLGANDAVLTPEQLAIRAFFGESAIAYWNRTLRVLADTHPRLAPRDSGVKARLFALATVAMADAGITSWNSKIYYNFWRPITAIRLGESDGNPHTIGNALWTPALTTPNYPDYTSGANNLSGAVTGVLRRFFRTDHLEFSVVGALTSRPYTRISDAAADVVLARILEGIHFRFADVAGRNQGLRVARFVTKHYLQRAHHHNHDDDDDGDHDHERDDDHDWDGEGDRDDRDDGDGDRDEN